MRRFVLAAALWFPAAALAGPVAFDTLPEAPPVIRDTQAAVTCTVTFLITDIASGDLFAQRIRLPPAETDVAVDNRLPCPPDVLPRLPNFARGACTVRAADPKTCVFADMGRDFAAKPEISNTDAAAARCTSDTATHLGLACWQNGAIAVCNVGCGNSAAEAIGRARSRCQEKQQRSCPSTALVAVTDQVLPSLDASAQPAPAGPSPAPRRAAGGAPGR